MAEEIELNLFDEIRTKKGFDIIILTTYTFDPVFFDLYLEKVLRKNNPDAEIVVLVDIFQYILSSERFTEETNRDYLIIPVYLKKVFHPKLFLFYSKEEPNKSEVIISSSNLTIQGITKNLEAIIQIKNNVTFLCDTVNFFRALISSEIIQNKNFIQIVNKIETSSTNEDNNQLFMHNIHDSILSQIIDNISSEVSEILIIAPFFSPNDELLRIIKDKVKPGRIKIAIQEGNNNLKKNTFKDITGLELYSINLEEFRRLHSKIIHIITLKEEILFIGSANFTTSALYQTIITGNCEASVLLKGDSFQDFIKPLNLTKIDKKQFEEREIPDTENPALPGILIIDSFMDEFKKEMLILLHKDYDQEEVAVYLNYETSSITSTAKKNKISLKVSDEKVKQVRVEICGIKSNVYRLYLPKRHRSGMYSRKLKESPKDVFQTLLDKGTFSDIISFLSDIVHIEEDRPKIRDSENNDQKDKYVHLGRKPVPRQEQSFIDFLLGLIPQKTNGTNTGVCDTLEKTNNGSNKDTVTSTEKNRLLLLIEKLNGRIISLLDRNVKSDDGVIFLYYQEIFMVTIIRLLKFLKVDNSFYYYILLSNIRNNIKEHKQNPMGNNEVFHIFLSMVILIRYLIKKNDDYVISKNVINEASKFGEIQISLDGIYRLTKNTLEIAEKLNLQVEERKVQEFIINDVISIFFTSSKEKEEIIGLLMAEFPDSDSSALNIQRILMNVLHADSRMIPIIKKHLAIQKSNKILSRFKLGLLDEIYASL